MKDIDSVKRRIKEVITLGLLLQQDGYISNTLEEEQFSCFFHGQDKKKSARYYRATDTAYCWVCKERWDCISYICKRDGFSFNGALHWLLKTYSIRIDDLPDATEEHVKKLEQVSTKNVARKEIQVERLYQAIISLRDELNLQNYSKFVYMYMVLKYVVPDEKFEAQYTKVKEGILKLLKKMKE
jgi:hypothetical protein